VKRQLSALLALNALAFCVHNAYAQAQAPAQAPAPATQAPATQAAEPEMSTVTVLGRLPRQPKSNVIRRLDRGSASSCNYSPSSGHADAMLDAYMEHFHGRGRDSANDDAGMSQAMQEAMEMPADPNAAANSSFNESSPYGDAQKDQAQRDLSGEYRENLCGPADRAAAAGRNRIARNDRTYSNGMDAYDRKDYATALEQFKLNWSKLGWPESGLMLGVMYLQGQGTARDPKQAAEWFDKVAYNRITNDDKVIWDPKNPEFKSAMVEASLSLANLYMQGKGVKQDIRQSYKLYERAAELGYVPAMATLARMNYSGIGVSKDPKKALKLYEEVAAYGYAPAQYTLAQLYQSGAAGDKDLKKAFEWYQQAAFNPNSQVRKPWAEYELARMYDEGLGTGADPNKALALFRRAAVAGHPEAQNSLATYFYTGQIVKKDPAVARRLFLAAAQQGQMDAMVNLAAILFRGEGGAKDTLQAYTWLKIAERAGHDKAGGMANMLAKQLTPEDKQRADAVLAPAKAAK
jgi:hypothetical protein